ncbi:MULTISPECIES: thiamine phosphate synthase [Commensalibacter]|uniref:Thiamine-phosphate synthase n=2 Tax=Commensalibacter TaxID=1079922 RepID=W7E5X6_9PROT|nr:MULTISPECIES: thiamine phosphate synthase [Commensalibacter]EUK18491.1 thiamine-phosphate pyrophosphorylase [Commensalibacter papalotli (ex Servin-Garciduenas et al. 2014)]CAI3932847.1 Thiamine monophosphate synthase (ThiE) (PDB:1G4T) (PUBMED:19060138) [Commensalibacter papalotli (ex Botero et al. 2024)]CAI3942819.1 Thiamine monophosphate synthase (ThiE) (PDB:1G4T) (PUBMED:19060138) [Commensalibacter papalotli (ex Botero et al. 2024)]
MNPCELYLITPPSFTALEFKPLLIQALEAGPVAAVQLRLKDVSDDEIRKAIDVLQPIVQDRNIAFILNDRPDLAKEYRCDGAHIGMDDTPIELARSQLGDDLQLGVSCYDSRDMAMKAGEGGADYIAFGAFFPTISKDTDVRAPIELLSWWSEMMELPVVAIGGITPDNCKPLVQAGADFLSVIGAVWRHPEGPEKGVQSMLKAIEDAQKER